jgi:hypothetical protein
MFALGSFWKIKEVCSPYHIFELHTFSTQKSCAHIDIDQKWIGLHFGRFFYELIWLPWESGAGCNYILPSTY